MLAVQEFEDCKKVGGKGDQGGLQLRGKHQGGHHGSSGGDQDGRDGGWGEVHHENMSNLSPPSHMFNINLGTVVESEMENELM